jgi:DNA-binding response OmpR family regulator
MKILIIDDDPAMTDLLRMMLFPSHALVYCANNSVEGLSMLMLHKPDLVVLDITTPDTTDWQLTSEIRKTGPTPILVLSVINNPIQIATALDAGADDYLIKPVPQGILLAHVNNLTRRQKSEKQPNQLSNELLTA